MITRPDTWARASRNPGGRRRTPGKGVDLGGAGLCSHPRPSRALECLGWGGGEGASGLERGRGGGGCTTLGRVGRIQPAGDNANQQPAMQTRTQPPECLLAWERAGGGKVVETVLVYVHFYVKEKL